MFNVINMETGELQCECSSFSKARSIAIALRNDSGGILGKQHFAVKLGDEIKYDTRNGMME